MKTNYFLWTMVAILCCFLNACISSEDEDAEKVVLAQGQSATLSLPANQYAEQIRFTTLAAWSAWTSAQPDNGVGEVEWVHLDDTHGSAGDCYLNFLLDYNNTGENRTAYIIIVCEDSRVVVTLTQLSADDPDLPNQNIYGSIEIDVNRYDKLIGMGGYTFDGSTHYSLQYGGGYLMKMIATWRDDMDSTNGDSYCMNVETTSFDWEGNSPQDATGVYVKMETDVTYYPSGQMESEDYSEHYAEIDNGRVTKGWYWWPREDRMKTDWEATYNSNGFLASTKNNDASQVWDVHTFTWENDCIKKITCTNGRELTFVYADASLQNLHSRFDLNWVLPQELECYDFAAADITKVFAVSGCMGRPSQLLLTSISETDGSTTYSYRMDYKENTKDKTVVTVMHFVNGEQMSYSEWTVIYSNIK